MSLGPGIWGEHCALPKWFDMLFIVIDLFQKNIDGHWIK